MGKKSYGPPNVGISACLRDLCWRYTIALLALTSLIAQSNAVLHAEAPASLIISKDGVNVNVSLDSQASSDVSIRRSDDIMMIKVPKSSPSKFIIDPSLKKDDIVQETETESGKTILIHSQQIYLMTQENLKDNVKDGNTKPASNSGKHATQKQSAEKDASIQPAVDTGQHSANPVTQPVSLGTATSSNRKNKTQLHQPPTIPLTIPNLLPKPEPDSVAGKTNPPASAKATTESANSETPKTNITVKSATNPEPVDPESLPIDLSGQQQNTATQQSTGLMIRVTLSLVAVLALLIGFIQVGLPKLMARYPEFFENLQQQARMKQGGHLAKTENEPNTSHPSPRRSKKSGVSFRSTPKRSFNAPTRYEPDSKRQYLERMNVHGSRLNVLNSTPIGKGSELHLVEVQGRQLVIATTPYTVSFVTDLTDGTPNEPALDLNAEPITNEIPSAAPNGYPQITTSALPGDSETSATIQEPQTTQTIAYLSDDSPVIPAQPKQKPYGSVPQTTRQATIEHPEMASAAQAENLPKAEAVHQKYLGDTAPHAQPAAAPSSKPSYVDAEEVIVLEDYDDVYGS